MVQYVFANAPATPVTLAGGGINSSVTTIVVATGRGADLPAPGASELAILRIEDEYVTYTTRTTDTLTGVVRGFSGSTAASHAAGVEIRNVATKEVLDAIGAMGTVPVFMVDKNGTDQTGVAASTWTKVTWENEVLDSEGNFASDAWTPSASGEYLLVAQIWWPVPSSTMFAAIYKNGSLQKQCALQPVLGSDFSELLTAVVQANGSTDYFEVYVFHTSGTKTIEGDADKTWFQGFRIVR